MVTGCCPNANERKELYSTTWKTIMVSLRRARAAILGPLNTWWKARLNSCCKRWNLNFIAIQYQGCKHELGVAWRFWFEVASMVQRNREHPRDPIPRQERLGSLSSGLGLNVLVGGQHLAAWYIGARRFRVAHPRRLSYRAKSQASTREWQHLVTRTCIAMNGPQSTIG